MTDAPVCANSLSIDGSVTRDVVFDLKLVFEDVKHPGESNITGPGKKQVSGTISQFANDQAQSTIRFTRWLQNKVVLRTLADLHAVLFCRFSVDVIAICANCMGIYGENELPKKL